MRIPLLVGTRVQVVQAPDDAVVLRPPPPAEGIDDVAAAVRDALRYPLQGPPLQDLVPRGGTATIVVEPPALPIPSSPADPRRQAIEAVADELARAGIPLERQTLLVAGGLTRRLHPREVESLVTPTFARRFTGSVVVHDAEDPRLVELAPGLRASPALADADLVVPVSAAHTFLHGGPAALLGACGPEALRAAAGAPSLLETAASDGWRVALHVERCLAERTQLFGVSVALGHPRFAGALQGYPYDESALERVSRSPLRRLFGLLPGPLRAWALQSVRSEVSASAVLAGPPSVAHTEALLRSIEERGTELDGRLDAICVAIPRATPYLPRERPNPLLVTQLALAYALRLWRESFPLVEGGTVILVSRFHRAFAHPTQQPYRAFFAAARYGPEDVAETERQAGADERALEAYRAGWTCHPLLPFADWASCAPTLARVSTVLVAGCRDAVAARQLGFVPTRSVAAALAMVEGTLGRPPRVGFLVTPPFFPLRVQSSPR